MTGTDKEQSHPVALDVIFAPIRLASTGVRQEHRCNPQTDQFASVEVTWTHSKPPISLLAT
jgi:hypothetical protein